MNVKTTTTANSVVPPSAAPEGERLAIVGEERVTAPAAGALAELSRLARARDDSDRVVCGAGVGRSEVDAREPRWGRVRRSSQSAALVLVIFG